MKQIPKNSLPFFLVAIFLVITGYSTYTTVTSLEPHFTQFHDEKTHAIIALGDMKTDVILMSLELLEFRDDQGMNHLNYFNEASDNLLKHIDDYRETESDFRDLDKINRISLLSTELIRMGNILILTIQSEDSSNTLIHDSFELFDNKIHEIHDIFEEELIQDEQELTDARSSIIRDINEAYLLIFFLTFSSVSVILVGGYILNSQILKQEELDKLSVMTKVARSVGHDLRNPLTAIKSAGYLLKSKVKTKDKHILNLIDSNVIFADEMIKELMDFAKEEKLNFVAFDIEKIIKNVLKNIVIPKNIKVITSFQSKSLINIDEYQIKRSLTILIKNSIDSMPNGGNLFIFTNEINKFIEIEIKDTGKGISDSEIKNLFTPFYTTKAKGMGLGLVNVKRIIKLHKGSVQLKSKQREGTTVTLKIPITE